MTRASRSKELLRIFDVVLWPSGAPLRGPKPEGIDDANGTEVSQRA